MKSRNLLMILLILTFIFSFYTLGIIFPMSIVKFTSIGIIFSAIFLVCLMYIIYIKLLTKSVLNDYQNMNYIRVIKRTKILKKSIINKKTNLYSFACLYMATSFINSGNLEGFNKNINLVTNDEYVVPREYWKCFSYCLSEDYRLLKETYENIKKFNVIDNRYISFDTVIRGILEFKEGNYVQAKNVLTNKELLINNDKCKVLLEGILKKIDFEIEKKQNECL